MYNELQCSKKIRSPHFSSVIALSTPPSTQENFYHLKALINFYYSSGISIYLLVFTLLTHCKPWTTMPFNNNNKSSSCVLPRWFFLSTFFVIERLPGRKDTANQISIHILQNLPLPGSHHGLLSLMIQEACDDSSFKTGNFERPFYVRVLQVFYFTFRTSHGSLKCFTLLRDQELCRKFLLCYLLHQVPKYQQNTCTSIYFKTSLCIAL